MAEDVSVDDSTLSFNIEASGGTGQLSRGSIDTQQFTQESIEKGRRAIIEIGEKFSDVLEKMPGKCEYRSGPR